MPSTLCKWLKIPLWKANLQTYHRHAVLGFGRVATQTCREKENIEEGRRDTRFSVHAKFGVYNLSTLGFLWGDFWALPRYLMQLKYLGPGREEHAGPRPTPTTGTT